MTIYTDLGGNREGSNGATDMPIYPECSMLGQAGLLDLLAPHMAGRSRKSKRRKI